MTRITLLLTLASLAAVAQPVPRAPGRRAVAARPAPGPAPTLSYLGFGPVRIGMTLQQAARALGVRLKPRDGDGLYVPEGRFLGVSLYVNRGVVQFIEIDAPGFSCSQGVAVGDPVATLVRQFDKLSIFSARYNEKERDVYAEPSGPGCSDRLNMDIRPEFKGKTMRFYLTPDGKIAWMRAGLERAVQLDEIHGED